MLAEVDRRAMASLSLGHLASDLAQGAPPALLVFLKPKFGLSYTMTGAVILVMAFSSSVVQPLFGRFSDRRGAMWLLSSGIALGGVGIGVAAVAPSYPLLLVAVFASGLGVGAFHPEGAKFAGWVSGARRASGMALFAIGGNTGFAIGPLLASGAIIAFGLPGGLFLAAPCLIIAALVIAEGPYLARFVPSREERAARIERGQPGALNLLLAVVALRSVGYFGLFTFVPLWEVEHGRSKGYGTALLSIVLAAGAVGTVVAGPLADRFGRKPVLFGSLAAAGPLILVYVIAGGVGGAIAVALAGAATIATFGVTVVMSQEYLPGREAMASGLSVGLSVGLGGVAAVLLGGLADAIDLRTAIIACAAGPALGALLTLPLPRGEARPAEPAAASL